MDFERKRPMGECEVNQISVWFVTQEDIFGRKGGSKRGREVEEKSGKTRKVEEKFEESNPCWEKGEAEKSSREAIPSGDSIETRDNRSK